MSRRLPTHVEVAGILRRVEADGGFATVMRKGDPDARLAAAFVSSRGRHVACLERVLASTATIAGSGRTRRIGEFPEIADFLAKRARFDEDLWAIELDIADPERFIAETTSNGLTPPVHARKPCQQQERGAFSP
jgi:hypothetical protein